MEQVGRGARETERSVVAALWAAMAMVMVMMMMMMMMWKP